MVLRALNMQVQCNLWDEPTNQNPCYRSDSVWLLFWPCAKEIQTKSINLVVLHLTVILFNLGYYPFDISLVMYWQYLIVVQVVMWNILKIKSCTFMEKNNKVTLKKRKKLTLIILKAHLVIQWIHTRTCTHILLLRSNMGTDVYF